MNQPASNQKLTGNAIDVQPINQPEKNPIDGLRKQMENQRTEFKLPAHISFDKFQRTVMTACVQNPKLLLADRRSLLNACVKAATDGLLPDGRESALVIFNTKIKDLDGKDKWVDAVQYMPMTFGILKKVRQSGDISMVVAHVVYEKDAFEYVLGDDERVEHKPYTGIEDRGNLIAAYAIAKFKDGSVQREVMTFQDIEKVRRVSKSGAANEYDVKNDKSNETKLGDPKGIWKAWYDEMARKTVFRRLAKWLPQAIDKDGQDTLFSNDDTMDTIDSVTPNQATIEKPLSVTQQNQARLTDESGQPDLGQMIDQANAKDEEKVQVGAEESEPEKKTAKAEKKKEAPASAPIVDEILEAIEKATSEDALMNLWNVEYEVNLSGLMKNDKASFKMLDEAFTARNRQLQPPIDE